MFGYFIKGMAYFVATLAAGYFSLMYEARSENAIALLLAVTMIILGFLTARCAFRFVARLIAVLFNTVKYEIDKG